jgi:hypothetical protein
VIIEGSNSPAGGAEPAFSVQNALRATSHGQIGYYYYSHYLSYILYGLHYPQPNASSSQPSSDDGVDGGAYRHVELDMANEGVYRSTIWVLI